MEDKVIDATSPGRVLVVDGNEALRRSTTEILQLAGYEALAVPGADEAIPALVEGDVALVLLDVGVDFTGLRLLADIHEPTQVILVSGNRDRRKEPRPGPVFLHKPLAPPTLLAEVESHLGGGSSHSVAS